MTALKFTRKTQKDHEENATLASNVTPKIHVPKLS